MSFTPTKEQLIELGFIVTEQHSKEGIKTTAKLEVGEVKDFLFFTSNGEFWIFQRHRLYPQSLDDLKTLIRLLTPPGTI